MTVRGLLLIGLAGLLAACADGTTDRRAITVDGVGVVDVWALESPPGVFDLQVYGQALERFDLAARRQAVEAAVASYMQGRCPGAQSEPPRQNVHIYSVKVACR